MSLTTTSGAIAAEYTMLFWENTNLGEMFADTDAALKRIDDITDIKNHKISHLRIIMATFINKFFYPQYTPNDQLELFPNDFIIIHGALFADRLNSFKKFALILLALERRNLLLMGGTPSFAAMPIAQAYFTKCIQEHECRDNTRQQDLRGMLTQRNPMASLYAAPI